MSDGRDRARERRWIVLRPDGRYSTLGRHTDPDEEEILRAEAALRQAGSGGWLAIAEGGFHVAESPPRPMEVRRLGEPEGSFEHAAGSFGEQVGGSNSG